MQIHTDESSAKDFIENKHVLDAIHKIMKKAETKMSIRPDEHKLIISYLAAIVIYENGQRPSVVQYMETSEYLARTKVQGNEIIQVAKHKTGLSKGPAKIVVSNQMFADLLHAYHENIRRKIKPASQELNGRFFLSPTGMELKKVYELMSKEASHFDINLPTPTSYRKVIASEAIEVLKAEEIDLLQKHMSHSKHTAEAYYQKPSETAAIKAHNNIKKLSQRRGFSNKEDKKILKEWPLTYKTPSLSLCKLMIKKYNIAKDAQQIQDRWKYLNKTHKA